MSYPAFRIPAPGRIDLAEIADDPAPLPDDHVQGTMLATAVSPGTELNWSYANQDPAKPASGTGYAAVFRVDRAGPASGCAVGEVRFTMYNHGAQVRCPGASTILVPEGVAPADAALARLVGVSWSTLTTTAARPPERVAVTGLGIIGNLAAQLFHAAGYRVLACDPVAARRRHLDGSGIEVCERLPVGDPAHADISLAVECSGHESAALDACRLVRKGGEVALVGVPWKRRADQQSFDLLHAVFHRYVHLRSGWEWEVPRDTTDFRHGSIRGNTEAAMRWLGSGRLRSAGIVQRADPRDCQRVYADLAAQRGDALTAVFDWSML